MMYSLQTLKLIGCRLLYKLPEGMRYMSSFRHIFLDRCYSLNCMPQGFSQLNALQTLTRFVIGTGAGCGIDQLNDLNLGGALYLIGLQKVHSVKNAQQGNISAKHNLKQLSLDWGNSFQDSIDEADTDAEGILEALCPPKTVEDLQLSNYTGAKLSSWMHDYVLLEHLRKLLLHRCKNCKDLPPLWQLPSLRLLSLDGLDSLTS